MKNSDLNDISAFVAVGRTGSFTRAALSLGVPKSYVSRKISQLEERLKLRLIDRTTRTVLLTNDGAHYFAVCERALAEIDDAEKSFESNKKVPAGHLRVTCPVEFGPIITGQLCQKFLVKHPGIQLEIVCTNNVLDLVKDKIDVAIRPLQLADPSMLSVKVGALEWALYASPQWVYANSQMLDKVDGLNELDIIAFNPSLAVQKKFRIQLFRKDRKKIVEYTPKVIASTLNTMIEATLFGVGIAPLPDVLIHQHVKAKRLIRVFPEWHYRKENVVAVFTNQKNMPSRVRALIDFFKTTAVFEDCYQLSV